MENLNIFWWHYPIFGLGLILLGNSITSLFGLPKAVGIKILLLSQLLAAMTLLYYPVFGKF